MHTTLHPTQINILKDMSFVLNSRFSDLKPTDMDPKEFTYHLKQLLSKGYITSDKELKTYSLTEKGKLALAYGIDIQSWGNVALHSGILLYIKRDEKILCVKRDKAPFLNYTGLLYYPTDKDFFLEQSANNALKELNLKGDISLKIIIEVLFSNIEGEIIRHASMFTFLVENPKGEIPSKSYEGDLLWLTPSELLNCHPGYDNTKDVVNYMQSEKKFDGIKLTSKRYSTPI